MGTVDLVHLLYSLYRLSSGINIPVQQEFKMTALVAKIGEACFLKRSAKRIARSKRRYMSFLIFLCLLILAVSESARSGSCVANKASMGASSV